MREISVDFVYSLKKKRRFNSHAEGTVNVIIVCCEDNYGRHCVKKSNNDYFHPQVVIVVFIKKKVVHCLLSRINKLDRDFLYWKKIITCSSPEEQRDNAFIRISP